MVAKLEAETRTIIDDPEVKAKFTALAIVPAMSDAAAFRARIDAELALMSGIVAKAKLSVE